MGVFALVLVLATVYDIIQTRRNRKRSSKAKATIKKLTMPELQKRNPEPFWPSRCTRIR